MYKDVKGFVNYQMAKDAIPQIDLNNFKVEEEIDATYLNEKELDIVYNRFMSYYTCK